ncbi:hypothetical protein C4552_02465 [Candidatus Parcubacteria bacterium]|nr:MAG: hypothetical protein C4552_02465 [Candidatus Parcubacteria bacterium]
MSARSGSRGSKIRSNGMSETLLVSALVILASTVYLLSGFNVHPEVQDSERAALDVFTWKTYESEKWKLAFKYPPTWIVQPAMYQSAGMQIRGEEPVEAGLIISPHLNIENFEFIEIGGNQTGDCSARTVQYTRCDSRFQIWSLSTDPEILKVFDLLVPTIQRREDISTWETYHNEEYGFEIMYPQGWSVRTLYDALGRKEFVIENSGNHLSFGILDFQDGGSFQAWIDERPHAMTQFAGHEALRWYIRGCPTPAEWDNPCNFQDVEEFLVASKDRDFAVYVGMRITDTRKCPGCLELFDTVLTTLRFY